MDEIYKKVIDLVSNQTGVNDKDMIYSNLEECVDARAILIYSLYRCGFSDSITSKMTGLTRQCVNKLKNNFDDRKKNCYMLSTNLQRILNELATNKLISSVM